jgi:hypothetical protein
MDAGGGVAAGATERRTGRGTWRAGAAGLILATALWFGLAGAAGADAEWCDDGSPPPNDFRLQPTGGGSASAPPSWLRSTDNGGALLETYLSTGQVDLSQIPLLQGGVATGMGAAQTGRSYSEAGR